MKTWLITGGGRGLGLAIAAEAMARGHRTILTMRDPAAARLPPDPGGLCLGVVTADMRDPASIAQATAQALELAGGQIDVLVNNAGHGVHGAVEEVSDANLRAAFETNVFGLMAVTRAILPAMRARRSGHVVNIGSVAGLVAGAGTGAYSATKFALEGLSESMVEELAPLGIRVTVVEPGPVRTDFNGGSLMHAGGGIAEYAGTAGVRIAALRASDGRQRGDPQRVARLICDAVAAERPPLHLPVGTAAYGRIRAKIAALEAEMAQWEQQATATDFNSP